MCLWTEVFLRFFELALFLLILHLLLVSMDFRRGQGFLRGNLLSGLYLLLTLGGILLLLYNFRFRFGIDLVGLVVHRNNLGHFGGHFLLLRRTEEAIMLNIGHMVVFRWCGLHACGYGLSHEL